MAVDTNADRLFHRYYLVSIPACDYYDPQFIKKFGMHTHPDKKIAAAMVKDRIQDHLSPAYLASWAADGIDIRFYNASDAVKVYDDIMGHLADWREFLQDSPLIAKIPFDGLYQFHLFAKQIYGIARENGLADRFRVENTMYSTLSLFRRGHNANYNPFRFKFNADIWMDIVDLAAARGHDVKRYRDRDLQRSTNNSEGERTYAKSRNRTYR